MIVCNRCGKENQNHYKFCLGCGAELVAAPPPAAPGEDPSSVGMMKTMMADVGSPSATPAGGVPGRTGAGPAAMPGRGTPSSAFTARAPAGPPPGVGAPPSSQFQASPQPFGRPNAGWGAPGPAPAPMAPPMAAPPMAVAPQGGARKCPQCGNDVPPNFKFCGVCGAPFTATPAMVPPPVAAPLAPPPQTAPQPQAVMTLIRPDGSEGGVFELSQGDNRIGRDHGGIFEADGYLSPTHAEMIVHGQNALVRDLGSLNGVFVRMTGEEEVLPGQIIRLGQELLRFDLIEPPAPLEDGTEVMGSPNPGYWGKITVVIGNGVDGSAYPLLAESITMGRERGDINFPDDGYVSGLHARLSTRGGKVFLADLGSSNGTFIRVQGERKLGHESFVLLGQQLFRLTLH